MPARRAGDNDIAVANAVTLTSRTCQVGRVGLMGTFSVPAALQTQPLSLAEVYECCITAQIVFAVVAVVGACDVLILAVRHAL